jgi:hypothetical protein
LGNITMSAGPNIGAQVGIGAQYSDATRTIVHDWFAPNIPGFNGLGGNSKVTIGNQTFPLGPLGVSNADNHNSTVTLSWNLASGFVPASGPVAFLFQVVGSDAVNKYLSYEINGGGFNNIGTFSTVVNVPTTVGFGIPLAAGDQAFLAANGGTLTLKIVGDSGWDFTLDSFGFDIPEPATLALVGLALVGAGFASRQRKA